jgi:DNA-binding winged-HTH domains
MKQYHLDNKSGILSKVNSDTRVLLGEYEIKLLSILIDNIGKIISFDDLMEFTWGRKIVSRGSLTKTICSLRYVLGDSDEPYDIIKTIHGKGYMMVTNSISFIPLSSRKLAE